MNSYGFHSTVFSLYLRAWLYLNHYKRITFLYCFTDRIKNTAHYALAEQKIVAQMATPLSREFQILCIHV